MSTWARGLRDRRSEVSDIYWYGSWVSGTATPSSDVDLCVIVKDDARPPRHRIPDYLPGRFPVGVDLSVLTEEELAELPDRAPSWYRAITGGRRL